MGQQMVGEVARGLSLLGGASSEARRCNFEWWVGAVLFFEWWVGARRSHGSGLLVLGLGIPRERLKRQAPRPTERSY